MPLSIRDPVTGSPGYSPSVASRGSRRGNVLSPSASRGRGNRVDRTSTRGSGRSISQSPIPRGGRARGAASLRGRLLFSSTRGRGQGSPAVAARSSRASQPASDTGSSEDVSSDSDSSSSDERIASDAITHSNGDSDHHSSSDNDHGPVVPPVIPHGYLDPDVEAPQLNPEPCFRCVRTALKHWDGHRGTDIVPQISCVLSADGSGKCNQCIDRRKGCNSVSSYSSPAIRRCFADTAKVPAGLKGDYFDVWSAHQYLASFAREGHPHADLAPMFGQILFTLWTNLDNAQQRHAAHWGIGGDKVPSPEVRSRYQQMVENRLQGIRDRLAAQGRLGTASDNVSQSPFIP